MADQFNELNNKQHAVLGGDEVSQKGAVFQKSSAGNIGALVAAAVLIGAGGCRSTNSCRCQPSGFDNDIGSRECLVHASDASEKEDAEVQAYSKSLKDRDMAPGELLKEAMVQLEAGQTEKAIVLLNLFLDEVATEGPRLIGIYQDVRFKLASLLIAENRMSEAADVLRDYLASPLADRHSEAQEMLDDCTSKIEGKLSGQIDFS